MLADVELAKAYRLLNHGPTVLVSSAAGGRRNVMAAAWAMPLDFDPPKVLVVIDKSTYSRELIEQSGEFILNIPCRAQAAQVVQVGSETGRDDDKFAASGLAALPAQRVAAPRVAGCIAYLECKVVPEPHNQQRYDLFIGEVVAAQADDAVFRAGHWHFEDADASRRSVHYIAGGAFFATGEAFSVA
ncbi:flavin reductase [Chromobacterium sinusclupearum]|uniref:Flavin reductase n=1 Tax=Chromobacterium sinusclupearum TaxID=2077146 RepID=A0A2K4MTK4_9NEIS|nr:flavin reductase family protein [Chromobacterium sinusclupearum]POB00442.1 flavin reductase [Chromobacterium sinusclupearum]